MLTYDCCNSNDTGGCVGEVELKNAEAWALCPECRLLQRLEPDGDAGDEGQLVDASYMVDVTLDERLARILGGGSGGPRPSLLFGVATFIILLEKGPAVLGEGRTLVACIEDYYRKTGGKEVD